MTWIYDKVKVNHHAKYLCHRSVHWKVIIQTHKQTHTQTHTHADDQRLYNTSQSGW